MSVKIEDDKQKWNRIMQNLAELDGRVLRVGLFKAKQALKGFHNEFGTETTPARSFLRRNFDERLGEYDGIINRFAGQMLEGYLDATYMLHFLGKKMVADIQNLIVKIQDPPNAPSTIRQKGSANPLLNKGHMKNAITYRFRRKR